LFAVGEAAGEVEKETDAESADNPTKDTGSCPAGYVQQDRTGGAAAGSFLAMVEQGDRDGEAETACNTVDRVSGEAKDQPAQQTPAGGT